VSSAVIVHVCGPAATEFAAIETVLVAALKVKPAPVQDKEV